jgi:hypothetical protein
MNQIVEKYKNLTNNWALKPNKLSFVKKEDFINYLSHLISVDQLGTFLCSIDNIEYLLEVEPWAAGCLAHFNYYEDGLSLSEYNKRINEVYIQAHKNRLEIDPDDNDYLVGAIIPGLEDVILGISYVLVKI